MNLLFGHDNMNNFHLYALCCGVYLHCEKNVKLKFLNFTRFCRAFFHSGLANGSIFSILEIFLNNKVPVLRATLWQDQMVTQGTPLLRYHKKDIGINFPLVTPEFPLESYPALKLNFLDVFWLAAPFLTWNQSQMKLGISNFQDKRKTDTCQVLRLALPYTQETKRYYLSKFPCFSILEIMIKW